MNIKKIIRFIHLWLGLASGVVIFIVALTGAIYVFSDDIINITEKEFRTVVPQPGKLLKASELTAIAINERARFLEKKKVGEWDWQTLYCFSDSTRAAEFSCRHYKNPDQFVDIFINPYTGKVLHTRNTYAHPFWDWVVTMHTSLMLGDVGTYIVDFATLFFLILLISGIVLWWPKNKAAAKQRFSFKWKQGTTRKRKNYDLHIILGFYACGIVIFMVITGLFWAFSWFKMATFFSLDGKQPVENTVSLKPSPLDKDSSNAALDRIYEQTKKLTLHAYCYHLNFPKDSTQPYEVYARQTTNWSPGDTYYFDAAGILVADKKYKNLSTGKKFDQLTGDIHYGWVFGWPSKIAVFLACLIVASLPVTGFYIWWGRQKKSRKNQQENKNIEEHFLNLTKQ